MPGGNGGLYEVAPGCAGDQRPRQAGRQRVGGEARREPLAGNGELGGEGFGKLGFARGAGGIVESQRRVLGIGGEQRTGGDGVDFGGACRLAEQRRGGGENRGGGGEQGFGIKAVAVWHACHRGGEGAHLGEPECGGARGFVFGQWTDKGGEAGTELIGDEAHPLAVIGAAQDGEQIGGERKVQEDGGGGRALAGDGGEQHVNRDIGLDDGGRRRVVTAPEQRGGESEARLDVGGRAGGSFDAKLTQDEGFAQDKARQGAIKGAGEEC